MATRFAANCLDYGEFKQGAGKMTGGKILNNLFGGAFIIALFFCIPDIGSAASLHTQEKGCTSSEVLPGLTAPEDSFVWEGIGPAGSTVNTITHHPTVSGLVYMGTLEDGLYYSLNDGLTWLNVYQGPEWINFIIIDPNSPSTVLVGASGYLRRSTDWGRTWEEVFNHGWFNDGVFDESHPGVVYVTSMGSPDSRSVAYVYRSDDGGESWTLMNPGGTHSEGLYVWVFDDLLIHPGDGSLYAYTDWSDGMGGSTSHVCLSTDHGASWSYLDTGLYDHHAWDLVWLFPGIAGAATKDGLYVHPHGTGWWYGVPNEIKGLDCIDLAPGPHGNIWYAVEREYDTADIVHRSTDWGLSWSPLSTVEDPCDISVLSVEPHQPPGMETILAGTWELGVFRSSDMGESWELRNEGLPDISCQSLAFGPLGSGLLYAGADMIFSAGFYRSRDLGENWEIANDGLPATRVLSICPHPSDDQVVFTSCGGIYRTTDQGDSWIHLENGLDEAGSVFCLVMTPEHTIFAGAETGVYRSTDNGDSWSFSGLLDGSVKDLSFDPLNPSHMFAASYVPGGIYESTDGGDRWDPVLTDVNIWDDFVSVAVAPGGERVYAGMLFSQEFYRSTNGGDTWDVVLNKEAEAIVIPYEYPLAVACGGSDTDVWISINGGEDWFTLPGGPADQDVLDLAIANPGEGLLHAATTAGIQRLSF